MWHVKTTRKVSIVLALFAAVFVLPWWVFYSRDHVWQVRFEPTAWKRADPIKNHRTVRSQMIQDLLQRHKFEGWTKQQIEKVLGPPDQGEGFSQWDIFYHLGKERQGGYSLDNEVLGFEFDTSGKVIKYGLSVD